LNNQQEVKQGEIQRLLRENFSAAKRLKQLMEEVSPLALASPITNSLRFPLLSIPALAFSPTLFSPTLFSPTLFSPSPCSAPHPVQPSPCSAPHPVQPLTLQLSAQTSTVFSPSALHAAVDEISGMCGRVQSEAAAFAQAPLPSLQQSIDQTSK
jgi:hypothetical protein